MSGLGLTFLRRGNLAHPTSGNDYIKFADAEVERILMSKGVSSDGVGITKEDAAAVTSLGNYFKGNTVIETFNEFERFINVTTLATESFYMCSNFREIKLPKSIKTVSTLCFYQTPAIFDVDLPNLESISGGAFWSSGIESIVNLGKITVLPDSTNRGVFQGCSNLVSAVLSDSLNTIGAYAFSTCPKLETIDYDWTKAVKINANAFYNCTALEFDELNLSSLTTLGQNAFYMVKIKKINLENLTALPSTNAAGQICGDKSTLKELSIPKVKTIPDYSFNGYSALSIIDANWETITSVGTNGFSSVKAIPESLSMPNLTSLGSGSFMATNIVRVEDIGLITSIGGGDINSGPFNNCKSLTFIRIPASVTSIAAYQFYGCTALNTIVLESTTPPSLGASFLYQLNINNVTIYVPDASLEAYKTATNWKTYASRIKPLSELNG